jgi:HPt (histidine-containing phosphotransfer) domain-containing protein
MDLHEEKVKNIESPRASMAERTSDEIPSITDKARSDIAGAAEAARAEAHRIASQQKNAGADRLGEVAGAVHGAARSLETGMPQMASYVHDAAARLEDAAKTLRQRNVDDLMDEITRFARSQPVLFFGGAMLAGFALTRFLKSSMSNAGPDAAPGTGNGPTGGSGWRQSDTREQR